MLSRLKISKSISDEVIGEIIGDWVSGGPDGRESHKNEIKSLLDWAYDNDVNKYKSANVFRGFVYKGDLSDVLKSKKVDLEKRGYESWSTNPEAAHKFASSISGQPGFVGTFGVIISSELTGRFLDINSAVVYLKNNNLINDRDFDRSIEYWEECELIKKSECIKCDLFDDVECFYVGDLEAYNIIKSSGWEVEGDYKGIVLHKTLVFFDKPNKIRFVYASRDGAGRYFKRKKNTNCVNMDTY